MSETPEEPKSKAELLGEHIRKQLDNNTDLTSLDARKKDFKEFVETLKPEQVPTKSHYLDILKRELKRKDLDPKAFGLTSKHPTFVKKTTDMKTTLTAHPSKVDSKQTPETKPEIKTETKTGTGTTTITTTSQDETGKIIEEMRINYTEKSVAIILKSMYNVLKIKYPTIEPLNDEEKEILGELWTPAFQKYLADKYFILIMPIFASIALISPKIVKAKKANKKSKEQIENEIKKLEKKKLELENKGSKNGHKKNSS